ncbi:MAG: PEP-CTERM sorting domain-containing protein [Candidatus Acidiferrales bacterium]
MIRGMLGAKQLLRRWPSVALLALGSVVMAMAVVPRHHSPLPSEVPASFPQAGYELSPLANFTLPDGAVALPERAVYPYSIIPGGALNGDELRSALASDPVAAVHYVGFDASKAHVVRLAQAREAYVSYRIGERVYWTKHKLHLAKGESVLTDGVNFARTRCGNRLSDGPQQPVAAAEPLPAMLETPQNPVPLAIATPSDFDLAPIPQIAIGPFADNIPPAGGLPSGPIPPVVLGPGSGGGGNTGGGGGGTGGGGGGGGTGGGGGSPPVIPPGTPPLTPTPESGTLLLLASGIAGLWLLRKKSRA